MSIYALADLHLSLSCPDKSMEVFGLSWGDYISRQGKISDLYQIFPEGSSCAAATMITGGPRSRRWKSFWLQKDLPTWSLSGPT